MKFHFKVHTAVPYLKLDTNQVARLHCIRCSKLYFLEKYVLHFMLCMYQCVLCYTTPADANLSELTTASPTLMYKLQNKLSKLLTHNVMQSPSVKDLLYESSCLSEEEIANSEAAKGIQQSQYITAVLQSKNLATFRELIQFLVNRKKQEAAEKLLATHLFRWFE